MNPRREVRHLVLRGARILDPARGLDATGDLRVVDGEVRGGAPRGAPSPEVVPCEGLVLAPAFVDPHVHFRDPGDGRSETVASGLEAAERGGYAAVLAMANTEPPNDRPEVTRAMLRAAAASGSPVRLYPVSAATRGLGGEEVADLESQRAAGAVAVSDDGRPVLGDAVMEEVLGRAAALGMPVLSHCETPPLHPAGVAHDGPAARALGLPGIPAESETRMVLRDLALAERLRAPVHLCHLSAAASVEAVRAAKGRGVPVTAEAAPHHLVLDEGALRRPGPGGGPDPYLKMNPPLRGVEDRRALVAALADGTVDCVGTDHAPHAEPRKRVAGFLGAAFGVIGLENAFAVLHDRLVLPGLLPLTTLLLRMGEGAARAARVPPGSLAEGTRAGLVLLDLEARWRVDAAAFASRSRNCPFDGETLRGRVAGLVLGRWVRA